MTLGRISFGPLAHTTLGFEKFFDDVERLLSADIQKTTTSFPPHNILKLDDTRYIVELAVAGFGRDEIDISVQDGTLTIRGEKLDKDTETTYLHRGIGTRNFTHHFTLSDTVVVKSADIEKGLLVVKLENIIPEEKKPRKIDIGGELLLENGK